MTYQFEWDNANLAKIDLVKKSGRIFSINEIESIFEDENKFFEESYPDALTNEPRFQIIGKSNKDNVLIITFVFRNGKIRVFNVWKAKQGKLKRYDEKVRNLEK